MFKNKDKCILKEELSDLQYRVVFESATEPAFTNEYFEHFQKGIYVDVTNGQPLFSSKDKFQCSCGWPSFSKPIDSDFIVEIDDLSHGMKRIEVRTRLSDIHLGHVFNDGPKDQGGLRYCINSAALKFISIDDMNNELYCEYLKNI